MGNRNYFGQKRIDAAKSHRIHNQMRRIAKVRQATPALQRGLQVNIEFQGDRAAFLRAVQTQAGAQTALVLLNKGSAPAEFRIDDLLAPGTWQARVGGGSANVGTDGVLAATVPAHGVEVYVLDGPVTHARLRDALMHAAARSRRD
jgi:cyclomaltodextrin glucanotransferase